MMSFAKADVVQAEDFKVLLDLNSHLHIANHLAHWPSPQVQMTEGLVTGGLLVALAELLLRSGLSTLTINRADIEQMCEDNLQIGIAGGESLTVTLQTRQQTAPAQGRTH